MCKLQLSLLLASSFKNRKIDNIYPENLLNNTGLSSLSILSSSQLGSKYFTILLNYK